MQRIELDEDLDPRRTPRGARTRDFKSISRTIAVPRLRELLASLLLRLGLAR